VLTGFSIERSFLIAQRIAAREWRLLVPVMLAFMVLPPVASDLLLPASVRLELTAAMQTGNPAPVMAAAAWLLPLSVVLFLSGMLGGLAITALALIPNLSVREAITLGIRRLPVLVGVLALLAVAVTGAAFLITFLLIMARLAIPAVQSLLLGIMVGFIVVAAVRLSVLNPLIVTRRLSPVGVLRESWSLTRGLFWRLFATLAIYVLGSLVVMIALGSAVGTVLILIGTATGAVELMTALNALFSRLLAGVIGLGLHLIGAAFFVQLRESSRGI
jgi:hypothetical protein